MSKITNNYNEVNEAATVNRSQIEHRATWMGLIYAELIEAGVDAEPIMRKAIRRCGNLHGQNFKAKCKDPTNANDFKDVFLTDLGINSFYMDSISSDTDNVKVDFHYCALVSAWKKLGFDDDTIALLCDIAMDGDRGIADAMDLTLDLGNTIAQGCKECKLHFRK